MDKNRFTFKKLDIFNSRKNILLLLDLSIAISSNILLVYLHEYHSHGSRLPLDKIFVGGLIFAACVLIVRSLAGIYLSIWRYARAAVYLKLILSDAAACVLYAFISRYFTYMHVWLYISIFCLASVITLISRLIYQLYYNMCEYSLADTNKTKVAIVGAGKVGVLLAEELVLNNYSRYTPYCFIDNNKEKIGHKIAGLKVYDSDSNIIEKIKNSPVQEIIIAIPSLSGAQKRTLYDFYKQSGLNIRIYDYPFDDSGDKRVLRDIRIEDLLFREPINVFEPSGIDEYRGKIVLVTGGGGSIGSEICRQIIKGQPQKLIIFDIYENNAYQIQQELSRRYSKFSLEVVVEIGSVRDRARLERLFDTHLPEIVFHAAAHKHVPLMENNGGEAVKNNVFGTYNIVCAAEKYSTERFILISTDKAVNPTNIMGATKRVCEMIALSRKKSKTKFSAVRFGNVLGSNGSVIPLFKQQIAVGGPVTITDKRVIRYFMTITEAAQLVILAGAMSEENELYVLDMGSPIKIYDLAENMIRLSGLRPKIDIEIVETGLRPGEKLYEELLIDPKNLMRTPNNLIFIEHTEQFSQREIDEKLVILKAVTDSDNEAVRAAVRRVVPTYKDADEVNKNALKSTEMRLASEGVGA